MDGIPITEEQLNKFESDESSSEQSGTGADNELLNEFVAWMVNSLDSSFAKIDERYETDDHTKKIYTRLSAISAKRTFDIETLEQSPRLFWIGMTIGLAVEKGLTWKMIQDEKADQPPEKEEESEDE